VATTLARCEADRAALEARANGLHLELCGSAGAAEHGNRASAVEARDAAIKDYFHASVAELLVHTCAPRSRRSAPCKQRRAAPDGMYCRDDAERVLALTREICALKLVESQLLASVAAAHGNSDASEARAQQLAAALAESEKHLTQLEAAPRRAAQGGGDVAELSATLAAQSQQVYVLQDAALQVRCSRSPCLAMPPV